MAQSNPTRRYPRGPTTAFGLVSTLEFGGFTLLWTTGVDRVAADVPAGPSGFIALNALATVILAAGTVVHVMHARLSRAVVLTSATTVVAVLAWLVVNLISTPPQTGFSIGVLVFVLVCVAGFTAGLLHAGFARNATSTTGRTAPR